jgi:hypothetical protein
MLCRLCLKSKPLCDSHIISETFFEKIYDDKHRFIPLSTENTDLEFQQKGFRKKLLCIDCEGRFSKWEKYLKQTFVEIGNETNGGVTIERVAAQILKVKNINYDYFKRGILSVLWRMGISKVDFFESYKLGPYEEKLRTLLIGNDSIPKLHYPFTLTKYKLDEEYFAGLMAGFPPVTWGQYTIQRYIVWGIMVTVFVTTRFKLTDINGIIISDGDNFIAERQYVELAGPDSVFKRIYDNDVKEKFSRLTPKP